MLHRHRCALTHWDRFPGYKSRGGGGICFWRQVGRGFLTSGGGDLVWMFFCTCWCWCTMHLQNFAHKQHGSRAKWNESGFRPPLCTYRLNWARRTSWGWWDDWDDTVLQTQDLKCLKNETPRVTRQFLLLIFIKAAGAPCAVAKAACLESRRSRVRLRLKKRNVSSQLTRKDWILWGASVTER